MKISDIYHFIRKILFEILLYFLLQGVLLIVLAALILFYPYTLNLLVALAFFVIAIISVYLMVRVAILFHKLKKFKDLISE